MNQFLQEVIHSAGYSAPETLPEHASNATISIGHQGMPIDEDRLIIPETFTCQVHPHLVPLPKLKIAGRLYTGGHSYSIENIYPTPPLAENLITAVELRYVKALTFSYQGTRYPIDALESQNLILPKEGSPLYQKDFLIPKDSLFHFSEALAKGTENDIGPLLKPYAGKYDQDWKNCRQTYYTLNPGYGTAKIEIVTDTQNLANSPTIHLHDPSSLSSDIKTGKAFLKLQVRGENTLDPYLFASNNYDQMTEDFYTLVFKMKG